MPWQDRIQQASYRGVTFHVRSTQDQIGRRAPTYESPFHDASRSQDLGRASRIFTVEAIFIGDDYDLARDQLIFELENNHEGELIHPHLGRHIVTIRGRVTFGHSTQTGGMCTVSFEAEETSERPMPAGAVDVQTAAESANDELKSAAREDFGENFDVVGAVQYVEDAGGANVEGVLGDLESMAFDMDQLISTPGNYAAEFARLALRATELARTPFNLADRIQFEMDRMTEAFTAVTGAVQELFQVGSKPLGSNISGPGTENTPSDRQAGDNARASRRLLKSLVLSGLIDVFTAAGSETTTDTGATTSRGFRSKEEAQTANDLVRSISSDMLDNDDPPPGMIHAVTRAVTSLADYLDVATGDLPSIVEYIPGEDIPAVVVSQILYGEDRTQDILARNSNNAARIEHPLIAPAGRAMEVLSE